ncbi:major capsid protein [Pyramimonas orientalis virus]|uniref:Major capsid protein n=2 Tax=Heliosvirus raunefjordenense TaxID=3060030 RepID=MCP_POV01|nr:major capsid protein [Pyramimonas orientalis virus]A7U6E9.1 RecName: Full=Major capsid protein; Short=MCP [Pyramimonas orientalis virus]ABU23714.1 putative major capsid protein [Pyramimonas orientalis virus]QOI90160.1 major capsid protein [Pyramimonas orientalis virus]
MGGGLMQLVAYGAQDIYLSGNPQITFFKVVYRRHTNFSMESIEQTFNGFPNFGKKVTCPISRNGDLIHRIYLQATVTDSIASPGLTKWAGHKLIKSVEVEIGGQRIDKHYADWLHIWNELTQTAGHWDGYKLMVNGTTASQTVAPGATTVSKTMFIPLQFWFCRNPGLALPLIALQYHEVKINLEFGDSADVMGASGASLDSAALYVDYIYLDTDERRRFAQVSHEYLIEQLQFTGDESASSKIKLNFNHPVKELIWVEKASGDGVGEYDTTYDSAKLQLNGHERFTQRTPQYFQLVQPYQHHERVPTTCVLTVDASSIETDEAVMETCTTGGINVYSFALKPEEHQPSGTCNMSRIDNATLNLQGVDTDNTVKVFAVNYNVLRVMSGMGGLAYSN